MLRYLRETLEPLHTLSLRQLTYKTLFLVALATSRRVSALAALSGRPGDIQFSASGDKSVTLVLLPEFRAKNQPSDCASEPGSIKSLCAILGPDDQDRYLCPVRCLRYYLRRSKNIRGQRRKLFLSVNPHYKQDVRSTTFSRWIVTLIKQAYASADMTIDSVRAHEVRAISASLALTRGVSLATILRAAYWKASLHSYPTT